MVFDGLTSSFDGRHMVQQASFVSRDLGISRDDQDEWAYRSHQRAAAAQEEGRFDDEIVPVGDLAADEHPTRHDAREAFLLQPVFDPDGTTTAGNAPGVNDGASCVIVCSRNWPAVAGCRCSPRSSRRATSPTTSPTLRGHRARGRASAREGRRDRRREARRDQRGLRIGGQELHADARRRRGGRERQRRRGCTGAPDRCIGGRIVGTMHGARCNGGGLGSPPSALAAARATRC